ncbi:MAG: hypothetical protein M1825_004746 [Sarcosagium campestre]|nr:MAG: hypothetical protein M1825_004746 [Sarcosagium campestre]
MPLNITIDSASTANGSSQSNSYSEGEDSSEPRVSPSSGVGSGSQEYAESYEDHEWSDVLYPDDIGPSESASHPRTSSRHRIIEARAAPPRRSASRRSPQERPEHRHPLPRARRHPEPISPESVDSYEDYPGYARGQHPHHGRPPGQYRYADAPPAGYAPSYSSSQGYSPSPYSGSSIVPVNPNQMIAAGGHGGYGYHPGGYSPAPSGSGANYFGPVHGGGHMGNPIAPRPPHAYGGQEMMGYGGAGGSYYYPQGYGMPQGVAQPVYYPIPVIQSPSQTSTPPPAADAAREESIARVERILLEQKELAEQKEAEAKKAAEEKAAADKVAAEEAAAAKKKADEEAAEKAKADAAAVIPAPEKKKPIKFKDAGMEELIRQAFLHVDIIGPHVAEGHYDLIGPNGEIILPQVWDTMIEPDWTVVMHMWPIPEPPPPEPVPDPNKPPDPEQVVLVGPGSAPNVVPAGRSKSGRSKKSGKGAAAVAAAALAADGPPPPPPAPSAPGAGGAPAGVEIIDVAGKKATAKLPPLMAWAAGGRKHLTGINVRAEVKKYNQIYDKSMGGNVIFASQIQFKDDDMNEGGIPFRFPRLSSNRRRPCMSCFRGHGFSLGPAELLFHAPPGDE